MEIAAVRVRNGKAVGEYHSRVKPRVPIVAGALAAHGISVGDVAESPYFESVWGGFRDFCGADVLVAHNGYEFDFPILRRMAAKLPRGADFSTYDTLPLARTLHSTSRKLEHLARRYGIDAGQSHSALDDCRTLARLFPALGETKVEYARKTALVNLLDQLAIGLALSDRESLCEEAGKFLEFVPVYALGRHSDCLDGYRVERDQCGDPAMPSVDELIALLGGQAMLERLRLERTADDRYPETMARLRRLIEACGEGTLTAQICAFLERAVLSKHDGVEHGTRSRQPADPPFHQGARVARVHCRRRGRAVHPNAAQRNGEQERGGGSAPAALRGDDSEREAAGYDAVQNARGYEHWWPAISRRDGNRRNDAGRRIGGILRAH